MPIWHSGVAAIKRFLKLNLPSRARFRHYFRLTADTHRLSFRVDILRIPPAGLTPVSSGPSRGGAVQNSLNAEGVASAAFAFTPVETRSALLTVPLVGQAALLNCIPARRIRSPVP